MNGSFYTAAIGAGGQQMRLNVVSNNLANINTNGYKTKAPVFSELMYYEMSGKADEANRLQSGTGMRVEKTDTDFSESGLTTTEGAYDYAIEGEGLFMLRDPQTQEITYTRDGNFALSQRGNDFYLVSSTGKLVLDPNQNPIQVTTNSPQVLNIGIFDFNNKNNMQSVGDNEYVPVQKNGNPFVLQNGRLRQGMLENSNVDFANEMTKVIESQRAYSYNLKMLQTSDEVESTINSLRN